MPILGAILKVDDTFVASANPAFDDPRIGWGQANANVWPFILETTTTEEADVVLEALLAEPTVLGLEVVSVDFADLVEPADAGGVT